MKRQRMIATGVLALAIGATFEIGRRCGKTDYSVAYIQQRTKVLLEQEQREPNGEVLLIGDSISERSGIHHLCGREVFNAGVSGAKLMDVDVLGVRLAHELKPDRVFVAIGTNDAKTGNQVAPADWVARYDAMIRKFAPIRVVLVPAPVIQAGKRWSSEFSEMYLGQLDAELTKVAAATGAKLLARPDVETTDALHPSRLGAAEWRADLRAGCGF